MKRVEGWAGSLGEVTREKEQCVDIKEEVGDQNWLNFSIVWLRWGRRSWRSGGWIIKRV